jgi:endogenous inhibitor of DNA gyrase (YacG/DUF329 family)
MQARFRPFCSARCSDVDLGRWFSEGYATPAGPPEQDEDGRLAGEADEAG